MYLINKLLYSANPEQCAYLPKKILYYASIEDFKYKHWYVLDKYNIEPVDQKKDLLFFNYPSVLMFENSQFQIYKFK